MLIMELEARLAFILVVCPDTLVYWVGTSKLTGHHLLVATDNATNVLKISMNQTEAVSVVAQWDFAVVYPTARVANANTISDNDRTFAIDYKV